MSNIIHETFFKDIIDLISYADDTVRNRASDFHSNKKAIKNRYESLTRAANKLILVFPVLCTKGISIDTASMLTKAIEKHCVNLLQMLFASIQVNDTADLNDYIARFHSNISIGDKITVDDFISFTDTLDKLVKESSIIEVSDKALYEQFKEGMKEFNNIIKTTLNENALSDFSCYRTFNGYDTVLERVTNDPINSNYRSGKSRSTDRQDFLNKMAENDIKKANELMPTKVIVDFHATDADVDVDRAIIGVKCKLYAVDSYELIERISTKYQDTNWVKELVRASTGEISFWRDFVFALDKAKVDAINSNRRGSSAKMWKVLERRATKHRLSKWKANKADSSPITTLIISQDEVEYLKKDYDINLENRKIAMKLMEEYNFMGIVIADEAAEVADFIWDEGNEADYETLSFRNLERESSDRNYKKIINLMTKISR
jgi:hypothetical protein